MLLWKREHHHDCRVFFSILLVACCCCSSNHSSTTVVMLALASTASMTTTTTTTTETTIPRNEMINTTLRQASTTTTTNCSSLSTSERDCLLTITSNNLTCDWVYDSDSDDDAVTATATGNGTSSSSSSSSSSGKCQEVVTTTTSTSPIIFTNILPENYQYIRPPRNEMRYIPWKELPRDVLQLLTQGNSNSSGSSGSSSLRYTPSKWNTLGTNSIEQLRFEDLSEEQKQEANALGYMTDSSWNCWQNHWEAFSWAQLDTLQLTPYVSSLGWTSETWNDEYRNPPMSRIQQRWSELSIDQRRNATMLCWDRTSYDRLDITDYGYGYPIAIPVLRFVPWKEMLANNNNNNNTTRMLYLLQNILGYDELTWNVPQIAYIEQKGWYELTIDESNAIQDVFGLDSAGWDCWMNHYNSYSWSDLINSGNDISAHFIGLGWSQSSWDNTNAEGGGSSSSSSAGVVNLPESEGKLWHELNEMEQYHATELCYNENSWDQIDMTKNDGPFPYPKPKIRFTVWNDLPPNMQEVAKKYMFYSERTWDDTGLVDIERRSWKDLMEYQKMAAIYLGMYERTWDCFQNHYRATPWEKLSTNVTNVLMTLGWNDNVWKEASGEEPESYSKKWSQLSKAERSAAYVVCYFNISWPGDGPSITLRDQYNNGARKLLGTGLYLSPLASLIGLNLLIHI